MINRFFRPVTLLCIIFSSAFCYGMDESSGNSDSRGCWQEPYTVRVNNTGEVDFVVCEKNEDGRIVFDNVFRIGENSEWENYRENGRWHQRLTLDSLFERIRNGDTFAVYELINRNGDSGESSLNDQSPLFNNQTALSVAAKSGQVDLVRRLLEHEADSTIKDKFGHTPLDSCLNVMSKYTEESYQEINDYKSGMTDLIDNYSRTDTEIDYFRNITNLFLQVRLELIARKYAPYFSDYKQIADLLLAYMKKNSSNVAYQ